MGLTGAWGGRIPPQLLQKAWILIEVSVVHRYGDKTGKHRRISGPVDEMQVGPHSKCVLTTMPDYLVGLDCWCWRKEKSPCSNWSWNFQIPSITRNQWRAWEESLTTAWVTRRHPSNINQRLETWLVSTNKSGLPEKSKVWIYQPGVCSWHSSIRSQLSQSRTSRGRIILRKLLLNLKPEHHNLVGAEKQVCRYVAPPKCQGLDVCFCFLFVNASD